MVFSGLSSAGTFNFYGYSVNEIQTQTGNVNGIVHNIATVNLVGSTTKIGWFLIDDPAGFGKNLISKLLTSQSSGKTVDFEYSDTPTSPPIYTQDNPVTLAPHNLWSDSNH